MGSKLVLKSVRNCVCFIFGVVLEYSCSTDKCITKLLLHLVDDLSSRQIYFLLSRLELLSRIHYYSDFA